MAERPDELNEKTQTRINEIDVAGRTNAAPENVYLETRSAGISAIVRPPLIVSTVCVGVSPVFFNAA